VKFRTVAGWILALGISSSLSAQPSATAQDLFKCRRLREIARRCLILLRSPAEFMSAPVENEQFTPAAMSVLAGMAAMHYDSTWDQNPGAFFDALYRESDRRCTELAGAGLARKATSEPPIPMTQAGAIQVPRDFKNRPIVSDSIIDRYIRVKFAEVQSGVAPRRAGYFTQFDYDDVSKRIEWARQVKRSQGGEQLVSTSAVREQFSDEEVRVLNRRWKDLDNAQNGRWDELQSLITGR
jgi:hypothetical protein